MKNNTGKFRLPQSVIALAVAVTISPLLFAQPAHAGYWKLTGTPTGGYTPGSSGSGLMTQFGTNSMSFTDYGILNYQPIAGSFTYTGTVQWVPKNGNLKTDPAPATVTISETSDVYGEAAYIPGPATTSASDGLGDPPITTHYTGYPGNAQTTQSQGTHSTVVSVPPGGSIQFTRNFSNSASGGLNEGLVSYSVSVK
jgi:hypothetical protein